MPALSLQGRSLGHHLLSPSSFSNVPAATPPLCFDHQLLDLNSHPLFLDGNHSHPNPLDSLLLNNLSAPQLKSLYLSTSAASPHTSLPTPTLLATPSTSVNLTMGLIFSSIQQMFVESILHAGCCQAQEGHEICDSGFQLMGQEQKTNQRGSSQ